jgi:hypothetical protein
MLLALQTEPLFLIDSVSSYFTSQWSLYVPHSGHYMYCQF